MNRFLKSILAVLTLVVFAGIAHAVWDSTTGNMPNYYGLCWGSNSTSCLTGNSISNAVSMQIGGTDRLAVNSAGNTTVTGNASITGTLAVTGAATFAAPMSSFTIANATGTYSLTTLNSCIAQSTVSLSLPTGISTVWVNFVGASTQSVTGSSVTIGFLIDGAYPTVGGIAQTSILGAITVNSGNVVAGADVNVGFSQIPIRGLSLGSHTFCLTAKSTSGTITFESLTATPVFMVSYTP